MTPTQQFILALIAALAGILIPAFTVMLKKMAELKADVITAFTEIDGKIYEVGKNVDGKMEILLRERGARERAEGKAEEAGEERERQLTATALLLTSPMPEVLPIPQTVIADKGEGWETPPMLPDETGKQKNRGE